MACYGSTFTLTLPNEITHVKNQSLLALLHASSREVLQVHIAIRAFLQVHIAIRVFLQVHTAIRAFLQVHIAIRAFYLPSGKRNIIEQFINVYLFICMHVCM